MEILVIQPTPHHI